MSYINKLYAFGFAKFLRRSQECSISGLIIPDIGEATTEKQEIKELCEEFKIAFVPVLSPGLTEDEIPRPGKHDTFTYLTSTKGITGNRLSIHRDTSNAAQLLHDSGYGVALGFGIQSREDVRLALEIADIAVVGSEIARRVKVDNKRGLYAFIESLVGK